jgi:large conductance mechanosensitive channel
MGFAHEFLDFVKKHQVVGLAVAFVIGSAATKMVTAIVNDLVMPVLGVVLPNGDWRAATLQVGPAKFLVGDFVGACIDFLVIAFVVFLAVKFIMKEDEKKK